MKALEKAVTDRLATISLTRRRGRISALQGLLIEVTGLDVCQGELVEIYPTKSAHVVGAEVIALREGRAIVMPHGAIEGLSLDCEVVATGQTGSVPTGEALLGRVVDAAGMPLDDGPALPLHGETVGRHAEPLNPLHRSPITKSLLTGVKAIDLFTPLGRGQRIGIFAGSGVGKSTLLGMISRQTQADVIVLTLIGERGREVADFIRENLDETRRKKTVVVAASADQPAVRRKQAAYTATCIAEAFRGQGKDVLLVMDSVTRLVLAQREIALACGEPMGARGFPASSLALLPPLLERAGAVQGKGSITGIYTVLVEGDDMNEPVADHMRAILDGHVVLSRTLAEKNHYPPIDVLRSVSRLAGVLWSPAQKKACGIIRKALSTYESQADFIELGAYTKGSNVELDRIIAIRPAINALLTQAPAEQLQASRVEAEACRLAERLEMA